MKTTAAKSPDSSRPQPTLETGRLILRPWTLHDAGAMQQLAGRREIADTMISIPHPLTEEQARTRIASCAGEFEEKRAVHFAIQLKGDGSLVGAIELRAIDLEHENAELSLWIGVEWWGRQLASEAAQAVVNFGFEQLGLNRIHAYHMVRNPASGRVMEKLGMKREGVLRQRVRKWGCFEDVALMAIVRDDWAEGARTGSLATKR